VQFVPCRAGRCEIRVVARGVGEQREAYAQLVGVGLEVVELLVRHLVG